MKGPTLHRPKRKRHAEKWQNDLQDGMSRWKVGLQFLIGGGLLVALGGQLIVALMEAGPARLPAAVQVGHDALPIIGAALILSAGVELAYMLFTPGPDEAIDPVILSLAATIFLVVSKENIGLLDATAALAIAAAIGLLFLVRDRFIASDDDVVHDG